MILFSSIDANVLVIVLQTPKKEFISQKRQCQQKQLETILSLTN